MQQDKQNAIQYLIYVSRPVDFDQATLTQILTTCRKNNTQRGITGALICRSDLYLQFLEGPAEQIERTYAKIQQDPRHTDPKLLARGTATERLFEKWAMRDAPLKSGMWTREEVASGAVENLTGDAALEVFLNQAKKINKRK
jgi:hypothetical protein